LGGILFIFGLVGFSSLAFAGARARLIVYFSILTFGIFQYHIENKDHRYSGLLAAVSIFAAAYLVTLLFERSKQRPRALMLLKLAGVGLVLILGHQLSLHLFPVPGLLHKQLAETLQYPNEPTYRYSGNQLVLI